MICRYVSLPQFSRYQFARILHFTDIILHRTCYRTRAMSTFEKLKTFRLVVCHTHSHSLTHTSISGDFFAVAARLEFEREREREGAIDRDTRKRMFESVCWQPVRDNFVSSSLSMLSVSFYEQFFSFASWMILHLKFISTVPSRHTHTHTPRHIRTNE